MPSRERSVLHVLPHPGGGGETYVDLLDSMPGYRFSRVYLAPSPRPSFGQLGRGVAAALRRGRRCDLVHAHGEVASGLCLALLATRPSVVTLNGLHLLRRATGLRRRAAVTNLHALLRAADRMICVSVAERGYLAAAVGSVAERALVIHNGVPIPSAGGVVREEARAELGLSPSEPVGIWIGGLDDHKDPLTAVRAAAEASVALLVVGDGPLRAQVERAARADVRLLGRRSDVPRLLSACDFFVLTSCREGLSFALLEAMSYGLPAVVTDLPENVEAIGDSGFAVPVGDQDGLAAALSLIATDEDERHSLGQRARHRVVERFDAEEMARQTNAVYDDALVDKRG